MASYLWFVLLSHFKTGTSLRNAAALHYSENKPGLLSLTVHSPRRVDPDDADVTEENTLFVFLVLTRAAFLTPVGRVGELYQGALLRRGARNREGRGWKVQVRGWYCRS